MLKNDLTSLVWVGSLMLVSLLVVACGGQAKPELGQGRKAAEDFLAGIRQGKGEQLWGETSSEFKSYMGRDQFKAFVFSNPILKEKVAFEKEEPFPGGAQWLLCSFGGSREEKKVKVFVGKEDQRLIIHGLKVE